MTSYTLSPVWGAGAQLFDNSGNVLTGGKIETYEAGTTTNAVTYTDPVGSTFNSNPIIADASGRLSNEIWLPVGGSYKFVLKDANNVLIATYDNIPTLPQPPITNDASSISYEQGYTVTAGAFTVGATYRIASVGTTNFVAIGAAANAVGILFTATGVGSGTGTAQYSRTVQAKLRESISVKDFGAVGDGVTDDTLALFNAFGAINDAGGGAIYIPPGTYLYSTLQTSTIPSGGWRNIVKTGSEVVIALVDVDGVTVYGNNATLKAKNSGIGLATDSQFCWNVFSLYNCKNVVFRDVSIDGNRANQLHTIGLNAGHNHGFGIFGGGSNITIENCFIENTGSLRLGNDKRGDGVYAANDGIQGIYCRNNTLTNMGRWGFVLEDGSGGTKNYVIEGNTYYGNDRNSPDPTTKETLGFVDIENFRSHSDIKINNNIIYTAGGISFGGTSSSVLTSTISNIEIMNNIWHMETISGNDGYHDPITMFSSSSGTSTFKTYENLRIENNNFYMGSFENAIQNTNRIFSLIDAEFKNVFIRNNYVSQNNNSAGGFDEAGMYFFRSKLSGFITYEFNKIKSNASKSWFGLRSGLSAATFGAANFSMLLKGNYITNCRRPTFFSPTVDDSGQFYSTDNVYFNYVDAPANPAIGNFFCVVNDAPIDINSLSPIVTFTSSIAVSDSLIPAFKIVPNGTDASVTVKVSIDVNDFSQSCGYIEFSADYNSGTWTLTAITSVLTNATPPTVTVVGTDIVISVRKNSGGAASKPTIKGLVACANASLVSA